MCARYDRGRLGRKEKGRGSRYGRLLTLLTKRLQRVNKWFDHIYFSVYANTNMFYPLTVENTVWNRYNIFYDGAGNKTISKINIAVVFILG